MDGDYIELVGASSRSEVMDLLVRLLRPRDVSPDAHGCPVLTFGPGRTVVFVDLQPDESAPPTLAIGDLDHDGHTRRATARWVYETLSAQTTWRPTWTSDRPVQVVDRTREAS
ncbi:MAG TPA: hypothetical protein VGH99_00935 [Pseudonocardia sp.]|jgi:hypothetical protein